MGEINYEAVEIDEDKSREELHYTDRRADILRRIREAGHPRAFTQRELASDYDVSLGTINNDMSTLAGYLDNSLGENRAMVSELVFQRAIQELLDDREWKDAAKVVKEWNEFIDEYRWMENFEERLDEIEAREENQ